MSYLLSKVRSEGESRMNEEKKIADRKRNLIVLILRYLTNIGYIESSQKLESESHISLDSWEVADNIDLYQIIMEFEQYYDIRFGKLPKLVRKVNDDQKKKMPSFPKISTPTKASSTSSNIKQELQNNSNSSVNSNLNTTGSSTQRVGSQLGGLPPKNLAQNANKKVKSQNSSLDEKGVDQNNTLNMEIQGQSALGAKKNEEESTENNFFDVRVLKGMPDFGDVQELKELAAYLQRDILVENPNVKFKDIVGLDDAKRLLKEAVQIPLKYPHFFTGILEPWRGVLLYGPPGTGKTMLAKAVATECGTTFFNISASSVVSKWRGESEKLIRVLFELARHYQPSTIFLDELDSIMSQRKGGDNEHEGSRRMKTELLIQLDGLMKNKERVFLLAASNLPWDLDVAMLRRLEKRILVPLPSKEARQNMIEQFLPEGIAQDLNYQEISEALENYSGSDIKLLCKEAAMKPLRRLINQIEKSNIEQEDMQKNRKQKFQQQQSINPQEVKPDPVTNEDIVEALKTTKPSSFIKTQAYEKWAKEHGSV
ncbi:katanin p60 ATPase subunit A-like protein (macronuclear) [Tetrahymena thermophila SB210]|uniref:Katanin p60 ATPase-containing subunit A-like 2 n=1 Tax=Tetrahymena thermophila (strain SB210) TaxID=312017 RepID=Q22P63_TETTS|nr:katanin p60 ATPase subunit A-like protein [Tetrahymena thermophila SB210]EAR86948.2 katanin p60 ATPase subunit A-like protein [Tetrahymena thermophila SB210]|eukprot:XP_001007193.2 katanin p60 ATPase subunit A-like protein [Tetrahymena thermophila SB210]